MIRVQTFPIEKVESKLKTIVLQNLEKNKKDLPKVLIGGEKIHALSDRYKCFFAKGYDCVNCGIKGSFFALEKAEKHVSFHLNLYAVNIYGKEILMTKDHIVPKSKGGKNHFENYQTMCTVCNLKKGCT